MNFQSFVENLNNSALENPASALLEFSKSEPEILLDYAGRLTDSKHSDVLSLLSGSAYHSLSEAAWNAGEKEKSLDFLEQAFICCKDLDLPDVQKRLDSYAVAIGAMRPGRIQEIIGKTKLKYLGSRIYPFSPNMS